MSFRSYDLLKLVRDYGQALTLKKKTVEGSYNPSTGSVSGAVVTDYPFTGYFFNFVAGLPSGDELRRGKRRCIVPALGLAVAPDDEDFITGQGDAVKIVNVTTIFSGSSPVCYICELAE